jgi:hypothetical protein
MRTLKKSFIALFSLFSGILLSYAQGTPFLPQPILPLSEVGKFAPEVEKMRLAMVAKNQKELYANALSIYLKINLRGTTWSPFHKDLTKEEFAAREWIFYYVALSPLPSIEEIRVHGYASEVALRGTILRELGGANDLFAEKFSLDKNKFDKIRIEYICELLKKYNAQEKGLIEAVEGGMDVSASEDQIQFRKRVWDILVRGGPKTEEERYIFEKYWKAYSSRKDNIKRAVRDHEIYSKLNEESFLEFLFQMFYDDPVLVMNYLKKAGYASEEQRSLLFLRSRTSIKGIWAIEGFGKYIKKVRLDFKAIEKLAEEDKIKKRAELAQIREKWSKLKAQKEAEALAQSAALEIARDEFYKKSREEAEKRGEEWKPAPTQGSY